MAARIAPQRVRAAHQSLHHPVAQADWSDEAVLQLVREQVLPAVERHGPIRHWIVDDAGFPKRGRHSAGVARQYCGQPGKRDNCRVAATPAVADAHAGLPIACRPALPARGLGGRSGAAGQEAGVPEAVAFRTKPRIALGQKIRRAVEQGVAVGVVLADAGYGSDTDFRTGLTERDLRYVVGVQSSTSLWPPGTGPLPPKVWSGRGRPPKLLRRDAGHGPISALDLAEGLPGAAWRRVAWREGSRAELLASRFAAVRVRPAHRDDRRAEPRPEEWLLIEWPEGEAAPTRYRLSTPPAAAGIGDLVRTAKARWRIERGFRELKRGIGLGHDEGRGWRGFHHHAGLGLAASGSLVAERCRRFPPRAAARPRPTAGARLTRRLPAARRRSGLSATRQPPSPRSGAG